MHVVPTHPTRLALPAALAAGLALLAPATLSANDPPTTPQAARIAAPAVPAAPVQPALRATPAAADLALRGPIRIGNRSVEWGNIVELDTSAATRNESGHCRFNYRYAIINQGPGAAAAHVNRLVTESGQKLAEDAVQSLDPGQSRMLSGTLTLWSGEQVIYAELDADEQVNDSDRSNNRRRIRADVADGCPDPRPRARPPGTGGPRTIPPPPGVHRPPDPPRSGSRAAPPDPPPQTGHRAPPPQGRPAQGKPAPGPESKPVPAGGRECKPRLSATRTTAVTRTGAQTTAVAAWEAAALAMYGSGFRWSASEDQDTQCSRNVTWTCTASARPCREQ